MPDEMRLSLIEIAIRNLEQQSANDNEALASQRLEKERKQEIAKAKSLEKATEERMNA